jgi:lysyl-tRNA synthetase class 2
MGEYPSRTKWQHRPIAAVGQGEVAVRGRIVARAGREGCLRDASGEIAFCWERDERGFGAGEIVEFKGRVDKGVFIISEGRILVPVSVDWASGDWGRFNGAEGQLIRNLNLRAGVIGAMRNFFARAGFLEVETPALLRGTAQEEYIELLAIRDRGGGSDYYLAPSPELHMKRLLGVGFERIYQIGRSFRAGEVGPFHNPEFCLAEWYRAYASYEDITADVEQLVADVAKALTGRRVLVREGVEIALDPPWPRIGVHRAFAQWADIDLRQCRDRGSLYRRALETGFASAGPLDNWQDLFHKILIEKIEPELAKMGAVHLVDYPGQLAALAKLKEGDPDVAERAEAYVAGIELSNGYTELNDPQEQRARFARSRDNMEEAPPVDGEFISAMDRGLPPAGGVALGVDRLVMLMAGASRLADVMAFPHQG